MTLTTNSFPIPAGFPTLPTYSAKWRAIRFELSPGTGEWVTSHIAAIDENGFSVNQVLRPSVIRAIFGSQSKRIEGLLGLIQRALEAHLSSGGSLENWVAPAEGFAATPLKTAYARRGKIEALRMAARQSTVMCALDELDSPIEVDSIEEESRYWSSRIKDAVIERRPELTNYFDKYGQLYADTARFGFLTETACAHFANLVPQNATQSMRMARGKLQELRTGVKTMQLSIAKLVAGAPRSDDITLTDRQLSASLRAIEELRCEADESGVALDIVHSPNEAADSVIALV